MFYRTQVARPIFPFPHPNYLPPNSQNLILQNATHCNISSSPPVSQSPYSELHKRHKFCVESIVITCPNCRLFVTLRAKKGQGNEAVDCKPKHEAWEPFQP